jgi:ubiquinone/menaquinone biosynthesis C-methylase UbiE
VYNQGKSYDTIAAGFAQMRDSFNTEQKYLDALIEHLPKKSHILDIGCGSGFPIATYLIERKKIPALPKSLIEKLGFSLGLHYAE